ncbi:hypothetical protein HanRHA438_Chr07g0311081 [Helianthus annuus]|nr:hypothetical protein HanRHA438_Chr07g0311081 [Helianthus annuus]
MDVDRKKMARKPGFPVNKQKQKFEYRPLGPKPHGGTNSSATPSSVISKNPFDVLRKDGVHSGKLARLTRTSWTRKMRRFAKAIMKQMFLRLLRLRE